MPARIVWLTCTPRRWRLARSKDRLSKSEFNVLFPDEKDAKSKTEPTLLSRLGASPGFIFSGSNTTGASAQTAHEKRS